MVNYATISGNGTVKYIEGKLRRQVNATAIYDFPIGFAPGTKDGMEGFRIEFKANPNNKSILGYIQDATSATIPPSRNIVCDVGKDPGAGQQPFGGCVGGPDGILDLYVLDNSLDLPNEWVVTASDASGTTNYDATFYPGAVLDDLTRYYNIPTSCSNPYQNNLLRVMSKDAQIGGTSANYPFTGFPWAHITSFAWCQFTPNGQQAITLAGQSSFSLFRIHGTVPSGVTALPVELVHFSIQAVNNEYFDLTWETASEQNNAGFYLQRSDNDGTTFENISWIAGNGNSTLPQAYAFSDKNVEANKIYYYRLQQVDFDQTYSYSNILSGKLEGTTIDAVHVFPNPTTDITQATIYSSKDGDLTISIYDVLGSQIKNIPTQLTKGNNTIDIDVRDLAASTYLVQFIFNDNITIKKIIKK
ncbi:MAG TPA: T9SS type A sorting domain-containing protein [Chitinophagales bacterium]|nr:T9SS type A sorting domain-containing protein [Chitinophagales bacterium]HQW80186.1 T9SS type A sorting domain-containing protein [Chitinophagales bacterium]